VPADALQLNTTAISSRAPLSASSLGARHAGAQSHLRTATLLAPAAAAALAAGLAVAPLAAASATPGLPVLVTGATSTSARVAAALLAETGVSLPLSVDAPSPVVKKRRGRPPGSTAAAIAAAQAAAAPSSLEPPMVAAKRGRPRKNAAPKLPAARGAVASTVVPRVKAEPRSLEATAPLPDSLPTFEQWQVMRGELAPQMSPTPLASHMPQMPQMPQMPTLPPLMQALNGAPHELADPFLQRAIANAQAQQSAFAASKTSSGRQQKPNSKFSDFVVDAHFAAKAEPSLANEPPEPEHTVSYATSSTTAVNRRSSKRRSRMDSDTSASEPPPDSDDAYESDDKPRQRARPSRSRPVVEPVELMTADEVAACSARTAVNVRVAFPQPAPPASVATQLAAVERFYDDLLTPPKLPLAVPSGLPATVMLSRVHSVLYGAPFGRASMHVAGAYYAYTQMRSDTIRALGYAKADGGAKQQATPARQPSLPVTAAPHAPNGIGGGLPRSAYAAGLLSCLSADPTAQARVLRDSRHAFARKLRATQEAQRLLEQEASTAATSSSSIATLSLETLAANTRGESVHVPSRPVTLTVPLLSDPLLRPVDRHRFAAAQESANLASLMAYNSRAEADAKRLLGAEQQRLQQASASHEQQQQRQQQQQQQQQPQQTSDQQAQLQTRREADGNDGDEGLNDIEPEV
jgi:hypothetical protein